MSLWACLWACVALVVVVVVVVEGQTPDHAIGISLDPAGTEICFCQPVNQRCPEQVNSIETRGPDTLVVDTRIVHRPTVGECPGEKKCCYFDGSVTPTTVVPPLGCGVQNPILIPGRPTGFAEATFGEYPWVAVLLDGANQYKGGGALIANNWVLTAAHKVHRESSLTVRLGELDLTTAQDHPTLSHIDVPVSEVIIHPGFDSKSLRNDVALLRLQQPVDTQQYPHIGVACLPEQRQLFEAERVCWVTGYGKNEFESGQLQTILKEVDVPIVDQTVCQDRLRRTRLTEDFNLDVISFLCAGGIEGKDACTGDGGAPLVCNVGQGWTVVGLVAWGIGCAQSDTPGVYVNVANFRNYIEETTGI